MVTSQQYCCNVRYSWGPRSEYCLHCSSFFKQILENCGAYLSIWMKWLRIKRDRDCPAVRTAVTLTLWRNARQCGGLTFAATRLLGLQLRIPLVIILCCAGYTCNGPIPRSGVFYRIFAGIVDSNSADRINISSLVNDLFWIGVLCNGPISRPGESYRMCVSLNVVKCSIQLLYLRRIDKRNRTKNNALFWLAQQA